MTGMTIHLVGLPHTSLDDVTFSTCAFTTKAVRWIEILQDLDLDVVAYWGGGKTTATCEVVELLSEQERLDYFGPDVATVLPFIEWGEHAEYWRVFNHRARTEIGTRIKPGDLIAVWAGGAHQTVIDAFPDNTSIEPAVGYEGLARNTFACFESYAWMHHRYGAHNINDGRAFDAVIPNFVRPGDFYNELDAGYLLFIGRVSVRKGPHVAADIAERVGKPLVVVGAGGTDLGNGFIRADGGVEFAGDYRGPVGPAERAKLMANASALIVPTLYIEPFGTVHVEGMMSGIPPIAPDYGVFTETIRQGITGFRYRTLQQAVDQVHLADRLSPETIRQEAINRFSLKAVAPAFDEWLWRVRSVRESGGWYSTEYFGKGSDEGSGLRGGSSPG